MGRFLLLDIGAGTLDVLWYDTESVHHYKAVVVSPVRTMAEQAARADGRSAGHRLRDGRGAGDDRPARAGRDPRGGHVGLGGRHPGP